LEGFGLIAAESLAAGTPALVTPVGGLPEVVQGLSPDLVMRGATPDDICEAVCGALGGRALPSARLCSSYARSNFGWASAAARIRAVYDEAVA
jgi:glycosyltransferase involved in cell wall biosynthesis